MMKYPNSAYPRLCEYLESVGIDAGLISVENFDIHGYDVIKRDSKGYFRHNPDGSIATKRKSWPTMSIAIRAVDLWLQEGGVES